MLARLLPAFKRRKKGEELKIFFDLNRRIVMFLHTDNRKLKTKRRKERKLKTTKTITCFEKYLLLLLGHNVHAITLFIIKQLLYKQ